MNLLVKILTDEYGLSTQDSKTWHLVAPDTLRGMRVLCSGQYFGVGESEVLYEVKSRERGGITFKRCINVVKAYKKIKL